MALHAISDAIIVLAYYSIPFALLYFVRKRKDSKFRWVFIWFAAFVLACGTTHLMEIWNIWHANYWLSGGIKAVTALISVGTVILLVKLMPQALALPSAEDLRKSPDEMEIRLRERTADLVQKSRSLEVEITERLHMEEQLKKSLKQITELKDALDQHAIIAITDAQGLITFVNDKFCAISKYTRAELIGQDHRIINSGFHSKEFIRDLWATITHGKVWHGDIRNRSKDGTFYWMASTIVPVLDDHGKPRQYISIRADITERKQTELALRESEAALNESQAIAGLGSYVLDVASGNWRSSRVLGKLFGIDATYERSVAGWTGLIHPDDRTMMVEYLNEKVLRQKQAFDHEYRILRHDDRAECWVHGLGKLEFDAQGQPVKMIGTIRDITEQKLAALQRDRLSAILEATTDMVGISDPTGKVLYLNAAARNSFGIGVDEDVSDKTIANFIPDPANNPILTEGMPAAIRDGQWSGEAVVQSSSGQEIPISQVILSHKNANGEIDHFSTIMRNISASKRAEEILNASESRYRRLFESARDGILILDAATGMVVDVNSFLIELLGFSRENILSKKIWELGFIKDIIASEANFAELQAKEYIRYDDLALKTRDGRRIDVEFISNVYLVNRQKVIQCNIRDNTERRKIDVKMRQLSYAVEQSPVSVVITDTKGNIEYVNRKFTEVTGYSAAEVMGKHSRILKSGELSDYAYQQMWCTINMGRIWSGEFHNRKKNGDLYWESATISPILDNAGILTHFVAVKEDITKAREESVALKRLAAIVEYSQDAIFSEDFDANVTSWNKGAETLFGYTASEIIGGSIQRIIPEKHRFEELELLQRVMRGEEVESSARTRQTKDGRLLTVSVTASPIKDAAGNLIGVSKVLRDITRQKKAEDDLRESEERFRVVTENAADLITVVDSEAFIRFQSPSVERILGYKVAEVVDRNGFEFIHPEDVSRTAEALRSTLAAPCVPVAVEFRFRHHDNTWRTLQAIGNGMRSQNDNRLVVVSSRDITESRKLEEQLRQSQKMEAIGQLAGGVAHDFNNILAVIQMQAGMLRAEQDLPPAQMDFAIEIEKATQRAANLTRQLLMFSRRQSLQPRNLDLNEVIANMTKMLQRIVGEDISMELKYASKPMFIHADAGMMDQVLMNLTVNSRDAMPNGGRLIIETASVEFDELTASMVSNARPGSFACLSVSDSGHGIPPEALPRIFEPFFTTKDVGKGTGLGLATIFGIVHQHQGWINVESEAERGTTFRIYLPRLLDPAVTNSTGPTLATLRGGSETILLVEDDAILRMSVHRALSRLGYHVLDATSGTDAMEVWEQHREPIHLLLTDLVMPCGMNGKELAEKLLEKNADLKVIYTSGYNVEVAGKDLKLVDGVNFLAKPCEAHKLGQAVRSCLDRK